MTGANDGLIVMWNAQFKPQSQIDLKSMVKIGAGLRSMDIGSDGTLLVGTRGADVLEIAPNGQKQRSIVQGHSAGKAKLAEVWGLAAHPTQMKFASAGSDNTVRVWNPKKMETISEPLQHDPTALDWSRDGRFIAVGDRNGTARILDAQTLQICGQGNAFLAGKRDAWVEDIKFSPCGQYVAFGTHGGLSKVDVWKIDQSGKMSKYCQANLALTSALSHIDWSQDSRLLMINSQANELLFMDLASKKQVNASSTKDTEWASMTCIFGWPVQGIWPGLDYTDVNSTDRSRNGQLLATGDDFGCVKLFKYPCVVEQAQFNDYHGHSSHVTKVRFSANDEYVVSTGGNDKTVMVWQTDVNEGQESVALDN